MFIGYVLFMVLFFALSLGIFFSFKSIKLI
nr:cytochrome b6-f complex subunit VI [Sahlingia subintegra]UNJ17299.1 cytochrome b6-f complex subunit VI [Sahlingia subintegra]